ncbi:MAG TPA: SET domain-containing protein-lysine N-methyltransferase [bacterium]|nr:SET domain-containing protein-lysine N-methyltransferase [Candidatus Magasanikbacteria bacterium]HPF95482.1 SET domain-containing protein-lysine N-methyltransferase [bacterium]
MNAIIPPAIEIKYIEAIQGYGVFATRNFKKDELIENAPVISLSEETFTSLDSTELFNYYFGWNAGAAIALGYASLYNHSFQNNATYLQDYEAGVLRITANKAIQKGDEILVDYTRGDTSVKLWFTPKRW